MPDAPRAKAVKIAKPKTGWAAVSKSGRIYSVSVITNEKPWLSAADRKNGWRIACVLITEIKDTPDAE